MRRIGVVTRINGDEVTFLLDERLDFNELSRLSDSEHVVAEIKFHDNRRITPEQRKKIFALCRDIANKTGHFQKEIVDFMKYMFLEERDEDWFSLSDCSVTMAREFITFLIDFCFEFGIPFKDKGIHLTDDINAYLFLCIKHRMCAICGRRADIHHVDTVGIGRDRRKVRHDELRLIALCRNHHTEAHKIGQETFDKKHHVQGILVKPDDLRKFKIQQISI